MPPDEKSQKRVEKLFSDIGTDRHASRAAHGWREYLRGKKGNSTRHE